MTINSDVNVQNQLNIENPKRIPTRCRTILWYMTFSGFALDSITRMNLSIAIVDMVAPKYISNFAISTQCIKQDTSLLLGNISLNSSFSSYDDMAEVVEINNRYSIERLIFDYFKINYDKMGFKWNSREQNLVLGSYYWLHWLTQIPAGLMARSFGTKKVLGITLLMVCLLCAMTPILAFCHLWLLIVLRVIQGMLGAFFWPAMHNLGAQWIPPNERSKFLTNTMGFSIGLGIFYPIFGYIIILSSWEWTFQLVALIGIIWFIFWQYFVYDSPSKHPHIDLREKEYILNALGESFSHQHQKIKTPWKSILMSLPVWMIIIVQFGNMWSVMTLIAQVPTYLKQIIGFDIGNAALLSGIPHLIRVVFGYYFSTLADYLLRSNKMSRTNVRKLATFVSIILGGIFILLFAYSECHVTLAIVLFTLSTIVTGAFPSGPLASIVDLSPNFAGAISGLVGTISLWPGIISPYIVGVLTYQNHTVQQWQYVFLISAGWLLTTGILYLFLSKSKLQSWNTISQADNDQTDENRNHA